MKLELDLVPKTCHYSNLRNEVSMKTWDTIRKKSYADAGYQCSICGVKEPLDCHEIWSYDDDTHVQKLEGFTAICKKCHMIKHFGFASIKASAGELDLMELINHFKSVNDVDILEFENHKNESFAVYKERSKHKWSCDLGKWEKLITNPKDEVIKQSKPARSKSSRFNPNSVKPDHEYSEDERNNLFKLRNDLIIEDEELD